ncbi:hypothetical protein I6C32_10740, partial [Clostridioides difficile]|nr:hypothetical protein [Clostridioides difficile]
MDDSGYESDENYTFLEKYKINKIFLKCVKINIYIILRIDKHGKVGIEMSNVVNDILGLECTLGIE